MDDHELSSLAMRLLSFGEALARALIDRRIRSVETLLRHPLAGRLPSVVRDEAGAFRRLPSDSVRAPIETLRYCYRLAQLIAAEALDEEQQELFEETGKN